MQAIDCNVLIHLLLDGEQSERARELLRRDADWRSEPFVLVELSNVLATWMRTRDLTLASATTVLGHAQEVLDAGLQATGHAEALAMAARYLVTAYDARYLAFARDLGVPLVTEDAKLRKAAPALTCSLADALAAL